MRRIASICTGLGLLALPGAAQVLTLSDLSWTLVSSVGGSGSITPLQMHVESPADGFCTDGLTYFEAVAPWDGTVRVHLDWDILDICHYDWPIYVVDGAVTKIPIAGDLSCFLPGAIDLEFEVQGGLKFGLGVGSSDCFAGPGISDWTGFELLPPVWTDLGHGIDPRLEWTTAAPLGGAAFGNGAVSAGDMDGDGIDDVVLGSAALGLVSALSGADGAPLWSASGGTWFGQALAAPGDVNADGLADVAVSRYQASEVAVLSGLDGAHLWTWTGAVGDFYGLALAAHADVNGDGVTDLAVGASSGSSPDVLVLSGVDGSLLQSIPASPGDLFFGSALGAAGDVDGDGVGDLLIATRQISPRVALHAGIDGTELLTFQPPVVGPKQLLFASLIGIADVNGDGVRDLAVGAPYEQITPGPSHPGVVSVHSGLDASVLLVREGLADGARFGDALAGDRDVDGDGLPDLAVGSPGWADEGSPATGRMDVIGGFDGSTIAFAEGEPGEELGASLAWVDGPAEPGLCVGIPRQDAAPGRALTLSDLDHPAGAPRLKGVGALVPGAQYFFRLSHALPGVVSFWPIGVSELSLPLFGGVLVPSPDVVLSLPTQPNGTVLLTGTWPPGQPVPPALWMQVWMVDPAGPQGVTASPAIVRDEQ